MPWANEMLAHACRMFHKPRADEMLRWMKTRGNARALKNIRVELVQLHEYWVGAAETEAAKLSDA